MKRLKHICGICLLVTGLMAGWVACKKDLNPYAQADTSKSVDLSIYSFLKSQNGLYDSLLYIIDRVGLKDTLENAEVTFFAPQDYSINNAMHNLNIARKLNGDNGDWTMDSVRTGTWDSLIHRYMVKGIVDLDSLDYADGVNLITTYGYEMNGKTVVQNASGIINGGSKEIQLSDKNGSRFTKDWVSAITRTVNLKTKNGLLHVLNTRHVFGFSSFVDSVYPILRRPFLGVYQEIPGKIEIGYFDEGGEGVAYHDADPANKGQTNFRTSDGVDLDDCSDGLYNIGHSTPGEWLKYSVKVLKTQQYILKLSVASPHSDGYVRIEMDGEPLSGSIEVPNTGGYQNWQTVVLDQPVELKEGIHTMMFYLEAGAYNAARFSFLPAAQSPYYDAPLTLPGTIKSYEFDNGGEGKGYHDEDARNQGNARIDIRFFEGVDLEKCTEGGFDVGYTAKDEWIAYTVNIKKAGDYKVAVRVASPGETGAFHLSLDGVDKTDVLAVPNTDGYQNWTDVESVVTLPAGRHLLKMHFDNSGFNWQKLEISAL